MTTWGVSVLTAFDELKYKLVEDPSSFVVILGAGVSIPAGIPSWIGLRNRLFAVLSDVYQDPAELAEAQQYIENSRDLWAAFSRLRIKLGRARYEREIVSALDIPNVEPPRLYKQIWQLNVSGIINFNLDRLALDAHSKIFQRHIDFATGFEPHKFKNYPVSHNKFVFHPHGIITDPSSWIFEERDRQRLYGERDFQLIMSTLLNSKNLLIFGFDVEEWSFKQLLTDCCITQRVNGYHNYYFCPNATSSIQQELGELGISVISYQPSSENHTELNHYLETIQTFSSTDHPVSTIYSGKQYREDDIPSADACHNISTEELRNILNGVVANIIPADTTPTLQQLETLKHFYDTYVTQLHRAWLVDERSENTNTVYKYRVLRQIGSGAFGTVYEAEDKDGNRYALKVLLPEVKDKISYLSCFRRGIRSMRILKEKGIEGMVRIHDSYEIPACIVMDMVDGITLREAIDQRYLIRLESKLSVLLRISEIIYCAHQLEERILHRDLKPENIILQDCYSVKDLETVNIPVTVLDFDLSWHRGATEKTVTFGAISQGFMAPEQIDTSEDRSLARNTAVDVYSLGMLAFFVLTSRNPVPNESQFATFKPRLLDKLKREYSNRWKTLPQYLHNTIVLATNSVQFDRMPLDSFIESIKIALNMYLNDTLPNTHTLVLAEIAEHLVPYSELVEHDFGRYIRLEYPAISRRITIFTKSENSKIVLNVVIERYAHGADPRGRLSKYFKSFGERAVSCVNSTYFSSARFESSRNNVEVFLSAYLPNQITLQYIKDITANILEIRGQLD